MRTTVIRRAIAGIAFLGPFALFAALRLNSRLFTISERRTSRPRSITATLVLNGLLIGFPM